MTYTNIDTERTALWLTTDQQLVRRMKPHSTNDPSGARTEAGARLLLKTEGGPAVHDQIALAAVDWRQVRDEINAVHI